MQAPRLDSSSGTPLFNVTESRIKSLAFNVIIMIGIASTIYFGILDIIHRDLKASLISLITIVFLATFIVLNTIAPRLRNPLNTAFVALIGIVFLVLLATQFPDETIALWCFPFPYVALFLLGSKQGLVMIIFYNLGIFTVFMLDGRLWVDHYNEEYTLRYCAVMAVISIVSYYFESSRARLLAGLRKLNQSLERRVEEKTRELVENQERLMQAEKLESIGLLAGGIAHDFNNQLTGIMAYSDMIRVSAYDHNEIRGYAENILASSRRSAELTSQLLAFARKGKLRTVPVDIHRVINDVIMLIRHTFDKRITIEAHFAADSPMITGDPTQLHSALLNLALNARDAMPQGGKLVFSTEIIDVDEDFRRYLPYEIKPGDYVHIAVSIPGAE